MSEIERAIRELHEGFRLINQTFFKGALPEPAILIQNQGNRTRNILGWCTLNKIWTNREKTIQQYEINITAEYLNRPMLEVMETMLHEMVHLYCSVNNIKDTSRKGSYHNKRFKAAAEEHGLEVEFDKSIGWARTSLSSKAERLFNDIGLNREPILIKRDTWGIEDPNAEEDPDEESPKPKKKQSNIWYCPGCETAVKSKKEVKLICGNCMKPLILYEDEGS